MNLPRRRQQPPPQFNPQNNNNNEELPTREDGRRISARLMIIICKYCTIAILFIGFLYSFVSMGIYLGEVISESDYTSMQEITKTKPSKHYFNNLYWSDLDEEARNAASMLGYNKEYWDHDRDLPIFGIPFANLNLTEKEAARYLHVVDDFNHEVPWFSLNEPAQDAANLLGYNETLWNQHYPIPILMNRTTTAKRLEALPSYLLSAIDFLGLDYSMRQKVYSSCQDEIKICGSLWHGLRYPGASSPTKAEFEELLHRRIHIVIAHCKKSLDWMESYISGFANVVSIHVISKCGQKVEGAPLNTTVVRIPNVGRVDHSYAYYITSILPTLVNNSEGNDTIVAFLKDTTSDIVHQKQLLREDFKSMIRGAASSNGFACNLIPKEISMGAYHDKAQLFTFHIKRYKKGERDYNVSKTAPPFQSSYKTFGDYYSKVLKSANPRPDLVQVCFGGGFASSLENILKQDVMVWKSFEHSLTRGDNIQEGHYAERCWALLLANPLEQFQIKALRNYSTSCDGCHFGNSYGTSYA